jgi:hypothetical protein
LVCSQGRERKGRRRGRGGFRAAAAAAGEQGGRRKEGGREADRWGPGVSDSKRKRKERERDGPTRGGLDGPAGRLGRKVSWEWFSLFFLFLFSNFFFKPFFIPNSNQTFSNFFSRIL